MWWWTGNWMKAAQFYPYVDRDAGSQDAGIYGNAASYAELRQFI